MLCTDEAAKKLFNAIEFQSINGENITPEEALENFKQALEKGADVNTFEDGMTPLMCITVAFSSSISDEEQSKLKLMAKLLVERKDVDINIKSKQASYY